MKREENQTNIQLCTNHKKCKYTICVFYDWYQTGMPPVEHRTDKKVWQKIRGRQKKSKKCICFLRRKNYRRKCAKVC